MYCLLLHPFRFYHPELKCRTIKFPDDETADNVSRAEFFDMNKGFEWVVKVNEGEIGDTLQ